MLHIEISVYQIAYNIKINKIFIFTYQFFIMLLFMIFIEVFLIMGLFKIDVDKVKDIFVYKILNIYIYYFLLFFILILFPLDFEKLIIFNFNLYFDTIILFH